MGLVLIQVFQGKLLGNQERLALLRLECLSQRLGVRI
jgi:hypothetical protein